MTDLERFEAWLVLQMLPGPEADAALSSLAGSRERAEFGAREFAARTGIERPGCPAATYRVILGAPRRSTPLPLSAMSERFAGSVADDYFLPIWHRHLFRVCRHPEGWAWGERFVTIDRARVDSTIVPWAWTSDELRAFAEEAEELDTWNYRSDWRFRLHGDTTWYRGSFDYELLQRWT